MSKTTFLEGKILDHVLRNTAYTSPTTVYIALLTADPGEAGSQTNEVVGNGYAREIITFTAPSGSPQATENTALIQFDTPTGSWGTISHWAVVDALTVGNYLYKGIFDSAKAVSTSDDVEIPAGEIDISED